jgi:hypothetical protein
VFLARRTWDRARWVSKGFARRRGQRRALRGFDAGRSSSVRDVGLLINFCDCFMAGGTSRKDHSEVGSSYIHFNFTPDGDKATASLFGDVPRGVMLKQPRIFLGGQGGAVGPLICGYGNVVAAGSILRRSHPNEIQLIFRPSRTAKLSIDYVPSCIRISTAWWKTTCCFWAT